MEALKILGSVLLATGLLVLVAFALCKLVVWARNREKGAYVAGALFSPFMGLGNVVDPDFRIVNEAKRGHEKEDEDSGDPPNEDPDDHDES